MISLLSLLIFFVFIFPASIALLAYAEFSQNNPLLILSTLLTITFFFFFIFVILYANASLLACVVMRMKGENARIRDGLQLAGKRWKQLIAWSMFSATVGFVLSQFERLGVIGTLIRAILGFSWAVCAYFVIPLIIFDKLGPFEALKHGAQKFGGLWKRGLGVTIVFTLLNFAIITGLIFIGITFHAILPTTWVGSLSSILFVTMLIFVFLASFVSYFLGYIIKSAVYLHFEHDMQLSGFDNALLHMAFKPKVNSAF